MVKLRNVSRSFFNSVPLVLIACGSDLEQAKADFELPTGSIHDREAVIAAASQRVLLYEHGVGALIDACVFAGNFDDCEQKRAIGSASDLEIEEEGEYRKGSSTCSPLLVTMPCTPDPGGFSYTAVWSYSISGPEESIRHRGAERSARSAGRLIDYARLFYVRDHEGDEVAYTVQWISDDRPCADNPGMSCHFDHPIEARLYSIAAKDGYVSCEPLRTRSTRCRGYELDPPDQFGQQRMRDSTVELTWDVSEGR